MKPIREEIQLTAEGIDHASQACAEFLKNVGQDHRSALVARLSLETALLGLRDHLGDGAYASIHTSGLFGRQRLTINAPGPRRDTRDEGDWDEWGEAAMEAAGIHPSYVYRSGSNILTLTCPPRPLGPLAKILLAAVLAILSATLTGMVLSDGLRVDMAKTIVAPIGNLFVDILSGLAGPLVFFSVAWGVCGVSDAAILGRIGKSLVSRFLGSNAIGLVLGLAACLLILPPSQGQASLTENLGSMVLNTLIGVIPVNFLTPFTEGNMPQIIILGAVTGAVINALGEKGSAFYTLVRQGSAFTQFLMEQICRLLPAFVFVLIFSLSWSGNLSSLGKGILPLALVACMNVVYLLIEVLMYCIRFRESFPAVLRKLLPSLMMGLTTASSSASFGTMRSACTDEFGVSDELSLFGVSLGMVLNKPTIPFQLAVFMVFSANSWNVEVDFAWYLMLTVQCLLYSFAVPPVPGGMLAVYNLMFAVLGIPTQALVALTALDIVLDYPGTAANLGSIVLNVSATAKRIK